MTTPGLIRLDCTPIVPLNNLEISASKVSIPYLKLHMKQKRQRIDSLMELSRRRDAGTDNKQ